MMNFRTSHPLQPFWNLAAAPLQSQALDLALQHHLFALLETPKGAADVTRQLDLTPPGAVVWLDLLWSMGLLERHVPAAKGTAETRYSASPRAARFFVETSGDNCAQAWQYRCHFLTRVSTQLEALLKKGGAPDQGAAAGVAAPKGTWAQAAREQIGQEQRAVTVPAVRRLFAALPPLPERGRFLDLGAGAGHIGLALAQQLPGWRGVLCDQAETAEVAQENIRAAGLSDRVEALGCDVNCDSIGSGYDLIWCSSVLHFLSAPQAAVRKLFEALNPGGMLLLAHAELADDAELAARVLPFYAPMILRGHYLPASGELAQWMADAGFRDIRALGRADFPMAPVWLHLGYR